MALLPKSGIADRHNLVNKETVKIHNHGYCKRQPCAHAGGVGLHRLAEIQAEFGEFLNEVDGVFRIDAIDAANESQIIKAGQSALEGSSKCKRP